MNEVRNQQKVCRSMLKREVVLLVLLNAMLVMQGSPQFIFLLLLSFSFGESVAEFAVENILSWPKSVSTTKSSQCSSINYLISVPLYYYNFITDRNEGYKSHVTAYYSTFSAPKLEIYLLALDSKLLSCKLRDNAFALSCKVFLSLAISAI